MRPSTGEAPGRRIRTAGPVFETSTERHSGRAFQILVPSGRANGNDGYLPMPRSSTSNVRSLLGGIVPTPRSP
jgi:hypothetical protein